LSVDDNSFVWEVILVAEEESVDVNWRVLDFGFETGSFTSSFDDRESKYYYYLYSLIINIIIYYYVFFVVSFL
jgi:hypothetical protein